MTKTETENLWLDRVFFILLLAVFAGALISLVLWGESQRTDRELREEFEAVCTYEGGTVEGDVCIRDEKVILYKKTLDLEHQD